MGGPDQGLSVELPLASQTDLLQNTTEGVLLPNPQEIRDKIEHSGIDKIEPRIIDLAWLSKADPMDPDVLVEEVFFGNRGWAEVLFRNWEGLQIKVVDDPMDHEYAYIVTPTTNEVATILRVTKRALVGQVEIEAEDLYIADSSLQRALDVRSVLPPENPEDKVRFVMTAWKDDPEPGKPSSRHFGFHRPTNTLSIDAIEDLNDVITCCHETGHIWAAYLGIDMETPEITSARKRGYDPVCETEKRGWNEVGKTIGSVLMSEKLANIIGKKIAMSLNNKRVVQGELRLSDDWCHNQEASYEEHYLKPIVEKIPERAEDVRQLTDELKGVVEEIERRASSSYE